MKKIFIGLIFLFVNLNLLTINLMPGFVGCALICAGVNEEYECPSLSATRTITFASAIIMGAQWVAGLFGYGMTFPIGPILQLLVTYRLVVWAEEQGEEQGWTPGQLRPFRMSWYALAGAVMAAVILSRVGMALVWAVVAAVAIVYYIYVYYKLWRSAGAGEAGE